MRVWLILLCSTAAMAQVTDVRELGRRCQQQFEAGDAEALWPQLSPGMQKVFGGSLAAMKKSLDETRQLNGNEIRLAEEVEQFPPDGYLYARRVRFEKHYVQFVWSFDRNGTIVGLRRNGLPADALGGEAPTKFADYQTKTLLRLPFRGTWKVFWGGRTLQDNYHAATVDQRFAYDIQAARDGKTHQGDGSKNEQFFGFGQPVLAPAAGTVVEAVDGIADNRPGEMHTDHPCGNHVFIDHHNGEFSHLCHFQKGSVVVKAGAQVNAGDLIGKCGNSGNTSAPHLHYSLENRPKEYEGEGLPAQFSNYRADGKAVDRGEPLRGQIVSPTD